ncbi:MAG: 5'-nucleotidase C-terminal domain-containing protein [Bacteroidetes bacterium]|nr:5'-nucleotidase C-terminal domain-containing protein [Bacteroidota bacterium]
MQRKINILLFFIIFYTSNFAQEFKVNYTDYKIDKEKKTDTAVYQLLSAYSDSLNKHMNVVIGFATKPLYNKQPESPLGNFMTDCMKQMGEKKFGTHIHAAFINSSGIRSYIAKGDVTVGKVYELMPFDNLIVIQEVTGTVLIQLLNRIAEAGGWPMSGITMSINKEKKATNILVEGRPINENEFYTIANSDYIASGGSGCDFLKPIPQTNKGYLYRDALIEFIKKYTAEGKPVDAKIENRIIYANN